MTVASPAMTIVALPTEPVKDGFYFGGWYRQPEGAGDRFLASTEVTNHCTVYAFWSAVPVYTVSFDSKGGSAVESLLVRKDQPVERPTDPALTNHVFTGWYVDSACTQVWDFATLITADRTLYAGWEELARYTVSFDSKGGSTVTNRTVYKGSPVSRPADPERTQYAFIGWFADANCTVLWDFTTPIQANRTLYAGWDAVVYRVVYHANGAAYGSVPVDGVSYSYQANATVAGNTGELVGPEVGGDHAGKGIHQRFLGWSTNAAAASAQYVAGSAFAIKTNTTLYAVYTTGTSVIAKIGPAGGYIVYDNPSYATAGWRYLEAAPADLPGTHPWDAGGNILVGGTESGEGSGAENTLRILNVLGPGNYAASLCSSYSVTNRGVCYDDWFLPSVNELKAVYGALLGTPGSISGKYYWSSRESGNAYADCIRNTSSGSTERSNLLFLRPVRVTGGTINFDPTLAMFNSGPTVTATGKFSIRVLFTLDKKALVYAVALEGGSPAPDVTNIVGWYNGLSLPGGSAYEQVFGDEENWSELLPGKTYDIYYIIDTYGIRSTPVKISATTKSLQSTYPSMYVRGDIFTDGTTVKAMQLVDDNLWRLEGCSLKESGSFHFEVTGGVSWGTYWGDTAPADGIAEINGDPMLLGSTGGSPKIEFNTDTGEWTIDSLF